MTATRERAAPPPGEVGAFRQLDAVVTRPTRALVVVDGTEEASRAVDYVVGLANGYPGLDVVLLNIQPRPAEGRLRGYGSFKQKEVLGRLINELGGRAIAAAGRRLDQAGLEHKDRVELGDAAATILRVAGAEDCDVIVLGEACPGAMSRWLARTAGLSFGSTAGQVVTLARVPVVVVK